MLVPTINIIIDEILFYLARAGASPIVDIVSGINDVKKRDELVPRDDIHTALLELKREFLVEETAQWRYLLTEKAYHYVETKRAIERITLQISRS